MGGDIMRASASAEPGARMTIRVYRVNRYGTVTEDRGTVSVLTGDGPPPATSAFPPCSCSRCRGQGIGPNRVLHTDDEAPALGTVSMRAAATWLLDRSAMPGRETLKLFDQDFRLFLSLVIPDIEQLAGSRNGDDVATNAARTEVCEARGRLSETAGSDLTAEFERVGRLARSVMDLCDRFDALSGITICSACGRQTGHRTMAARIRTAEKKQPPGQ
ncbi:DUF6415 family natural product biosynthesis protein [Streptomyces sp. NPDC048232]|uniref:DUF6415 family natural product biosynthesis protein n=1 Tax=Streptomyces sp. NPDC048232 TaxID=3365520 RepID=UPI00371F88A3